MELVAVAFHVTTAKLVLAVPEPKGLQGNEMTLRPQNRMLQAALIMLTLRHTSAKGSWQVRKLPLPADQIHM